MHRLKFLKVKKILSCHALNANQSINSEIKLYDHIFIFVFLLKLNTTNQTGNLMMKLEAFRDYRDTSFRGLSKLN